MPHSIAMGGGSDAASLRVVGHRMQTEEETRSRPRPVHVSQPERVKAQAQARGSSSSRSRSRSRSPSRSRSRSPPALPRWSPGGSEGRFGPEGLEATDPRHFLRKGTGQWARSAPPRSPSAEEQWQQRRREHERERAASLSPPRPSPPHSASESPERHEHRRGRARSRSTLAASSPSRSHSASASFSIPASPSTPAAARRPFLRARTGGHAHPDLSPPQRHPDQHDYEGVDIELELSIDESQQQEQQQQQQQQRHDDSDLSPLRGLSPPRVQRYPFIRRTHEDSPVRAPTRAATRTDSESAPAPATSSSAWPSISAPEHHPPAPARAAPSSAPPAPSVSASASASLPGSTIASFIQRFRQQPPQPPSNRQAPLANFWWLTPGAAPPPSAAPAASASVAPVPPLPLPRQGTSTAEHLRQLEQQIDSQREEKRQQKLQQLAQQLNAEQEQESEEMQRQQEQQASALDASNYSFASDYSLLEGLDPTSMLSPTSPLHSGLDSAGAGAGASRASQPGQSILDDSDDFSALLPSRAQQQQQQQQQHLPPHHLSHSRSESALQQQPQHAGAGGSDLASSHDVDELLRRWRAERAAAGGVKPHIQSMSSFLHDSPLPSPQVRPRRRSSPQISPARRGYGGSGGIGGMPASPFASDDNTTGADVERLIAGLKKRLGLDREEAQQKQQYQSASSYDRPQQQQFAPQPRPSDFHRHSPVRVRAHMRDEASQCVDADTLGGGTPDKRRSAASASPSRARVASLLHVPLEALLERPRVAEQDYLESARKIAASTTPESAAADTTAAAARDVDEDADGEEPVPRRAHPLPSVPPLRLPSGPSVVDASHDADRSATERSHLDDQQTDRSPAPAIPQTHHTTERPESEQRRRQEADHEQKQAHPTPSRRRRSAAAIHTAAPRPADVTLSCNDKADSAEGFRVELRRRKKRDGSYKRSHGPRGVISIHITPAVMSQLQQQPQQPPQPHQQPSQQQQAPIHHAADTASVPHAGSASGPASGVSAAPDSSSAPAPVSAPASGATPACVHFISNAPPVVADYSLPSSPVRRHDTASAAAASSTGASALPPPPPVGGDTLLHEVVTRGLFCDPLAYSSILQQLVPVPGPGPQAEPEPEAEADGAAAPIRTDEQKHEEHKAAGGGDSNEEEKDAAGDPQSQLDEKDQSREDVSGQAAAADMQAQQASPALTQPTTSDPARAPATAAAPEHASASPSATAAPAVATAPGPYPFCPPPFGYPSYPLAPYQQVAMPFYPPFYPPPPHMPPPHMQHPYAHYYPPGAHMQMHGQAHGSSPAWNPWIPPPSAASSQPTSAVPSSSPGQPHQSYAAPLPSSPPPAAASAPLFSPSHAHLARLCAELGMTVAEYYADPPLQQLVQQLDRLQTQQAQVQHMQHQRQQQQQPPVAHAHQA